MCIFYIRDVQVVRKSEAGTSLRRPQKNGTRILFTATKIVKTSLKDEVRFRRGPSPHPCTPRHLFQYFFVVIRLPDAGKPED
ncbi:hypothetical protein EVAR_36303_1 [Eumeta japonica]|uniref:Uncharacterized protein n=1 Tax=Eumeta variegata TaxID=151549 RepID=A0A4C1VIL0_EUMVA|nr:hypothetical protein EVAR_36303_1 [Eumeta japonica]